MKLCGRSTFVSGASGTVCSGAAVSFYEGRPAILFCMWLALRIGWMRLCCENACDQKRLAVHLCHCRCSFRMKFVTIDILVLLEVRIPISNTCELSTSMNECSSCLRDFIRHKRFRFSLPMVTSYSSAHQALEKWLLSRLRFNGTGSYFESCASQVHHTRCVHRCNSEITQYGLRCSLQVTLTLEQ